VAWWRNKSERREERDTHLVEVLAKAMGQAFGQVLDAQSKQIDQNAKFLDNLQDLSARKAAQIMGSRGGRTTQERKRNKRLAARASSECPLCDNPARKDVTPAMVDLHRQHGERAVAIPEALPNGSSNGL